MNEFLTKWDEAVIIIADIDDATITLDVEDYVIKLNYWKAIYSINDYMKIQPTSTQHLLIQLLKNIKKIEYNRKSSWRKCRESRENFFSGFLRKKRGKCCENSKIKMSREFKVANCWNWEKSDLNLALLISKFLVDGDKRKK